MTSPQVTVDGGLAARGSAWPRPADVGLAAVTVIAAVVGSVGEILQAPRAVPATAGGVAVAVAAGLLVLARRHPVAITAGVLALSLLYHLLGYPGLAPGVAMFVTLYAVTAQGRGARSLAEAGAGIVLLSAVPLLPPFPTSVNWSIIGPAVAMAAVAAIGEAARVRRLAMEEQVQAVRRVAQQDAARRMAEERVAVAREVHDLLAHTITVIAVQAAAAAEALDDRPEEARTGLVAVRGAAREALAELRGTVALLRTGAAPPDGSPAGGSPADGSPPDGYPAGGPGLAQLPQLCEQAKQAGLAVTLTVTGERGLPGAVERVVYRIVQEAVTNAIRHAGAARAAVRVELGDADVRVEIVDDGPASDDGCVPAGEFGTNGGLHGLIGMRERAQALGGTLDAGPAPGRGFRIVARLPIGAPS